MAKIFGHGFDSSVLSGYVPYTGATGDVDLGYNDLYVSGNVYIGDGTLGLLAIETDNTLNHAIIRTLGAQVGNFSSYGGLEIYGKDTGDWGVLRVMPKTDGYGSFEFYGLDPTGADFLDYFRFRLDAGFIDPTGITFVSEGTGAYTAGDISFVFDGTETLRLSASGSAFFYGPIAIGGGPFINQVLTETHTLNFPNIASNDSADITVAFSGADAGDAVFLGAFSELENKLTFCAWVSDVDEVTIRVHNSTGGSIDPASGSWRIVVVKF